MTEPRDTENPQEIELSPTGADSVTPQTDPAVTENLAEAVDESGKAQLQKTGVVTDLPVREGDSANEPLEPFSLTFENHEPELIQAGTVVDEQGRSKNHRSFQVLGVFLLLWMFVPNVMKDLTDLMSWAMILAAVGLLWLVLKYPAKINARFAKERVEAIPECTVKLTNEGMTVIEGTSSYEIDFSGKVAAYDYMDGITVHAENNRIVCIPKNQLSEAELFSLSAALRQGLGDQFNKIEPKAQQGFFRRPK